MAVASVIFCSCGGSREPTSGEIETAVHQALTATHQSEVIIETRVSDALTATSVQIPTVTPSPTSSPKPTNTATPRSPTATLVPPSPTAKQTENVPPTATEIPPVERFAAAGYRPFNRPTIGIMAHPRLSFDDSQTKEDSESSLYRFEDYNAEYLVFDIRTIRKEFFSSIDSDFAKEILTDIVANTSGLTNLSFVAVDNTSIGLAKGYIVRHNFDVDGNKGYGVFMMLDYGIQLYIFDIYGRDYEYPVIEEILSSIFGTADLHPVPNSV